MGDDGHVEWNGKLLHTAEYRVDRELDVVAASVVKKEAESSRMFLRIMTATVGVVDTNFDWN